MTYLVLINPIYYQQNTCHIYLRISVSISCYHHSSDYYHLLPGLQQQSPNWLTVYPSLIHMGASRIALKPKANMSALCLKSLKSFKILKTRDFPGGPVAKTPYSQLGLIPGQGTRSHMLPLRTRMLQLRLAQPNKLIKKNSFGDFLFSMG